MFDDNMVKIFRIVERDNVVLEYKKDGELVKELKLNTGQNWKIKIDNEMCFVEIEEFLNEGLMPVMAFLKTEAEVFKSPDHQIEGKPAYPVSLLVSDGEQVKDEN